MPGFEDLAHMTLRHGRTFWMLAVFGGAVVAAGQTLLAYRFSPAIGVIVPLAIAGTALIAWRPILGVYAAVLLIMFDKRNELAFAGLAFRPTEIAVFVTGAMGFLHVVAARRGRRPPPAYLAFFGLVLVAALGVTFSP